MLFRSETLTGERLFHADFEGAVMVRVLFGEIASVRKHRADVPDAVEAIVARGLAQKAQDRFASAQEMAVALAQALDVASTMEVASWVASTAADALAARAALVTEVESTPLSAVAEIVDDAPARVVTAPAPEVHEPTRMTAVTATRSRWPRVVALGSAGAYLNRPQRPDSPAVNTLHREGDSLEHNLVARDRVVPEFSEDKSANGVVFVVRQLGPQSVVYVVNSQTTVDNRFRR